MRFPINGKRQTKAIIQMREMRKQHDQFWPKDKQVTWSTKKGDSGKFLI